MDARGATDVISDITAVDDRRHSAATTSGEYVNSYLGAEVIF